ncbi:MAG: translation initiation factor IF-3 [Myxococcota bacterium]|jgi:translation initiation factor IF-3
MHPRRFRNERPEATGPRVNRTIRVPRVVLIDEEGKRLGEFLTKDAQTLADQKGLDLVEVSPNARPPVCKIADFGKLKYSQKKRAATAKRKQHQSQMKELKVRPKTDEHDLAVKIGRARSFLERGDKVKITVFFRGREHAHRDIGAQQCMRFAEALTDVAKIENRPHMNGRRMHMVLAPV